jgi:hypothetical protein
MPVTAFVWARVGRLDLAPYFFVTCLTLLPMFKRIQCLCASFRNFVATVPVAWARLAIPHRRSYPGETCRTSVDDDN